MKAELFPIDVIVKPEGESVRAGFVLLDRNSKAAEVRMLRDWKGVVDEVDAEILGGYEAMLRSQLQAGDPAEVIDRWIRDMAHTVRIGAGKTIEYSDWQTAIDQHCNLLSRR